jgi:large subunit ribosomal protein L10
MFTRAERNGKIEALEGMFGKALGIYLTDINRIDVGRITQLRRELRKEGFQYLVVKNKLAQIALERCGKTDIASFLQGPIGVVFADEDATAPARVLRDFQRDNKNLLEVKAIYVEGALLPGSECTRLADIPSREVLVAQLLSCLQSPVQKMATSLSGILSKFANALEQVRAQKESQE